jgi:hypothetical protein
MSPRASVSSAAVPSGVMSTLRAVSPHARRRARARAPLGRDHGLDAPAHLALGERAEAEARAAALDRGRDLPDVVAHDAEAHVARVLLDHAPQRGLRGLRHRVRLVEHDELEAAREERARLREVLDLQAHDVDPAVVGRVQLRGRR